METNEASPASETNPTEFVKLEEGNYRKYLRRSGWARPTRGQD